MKKNEPFTVIHEDSRIIVVNKAAGIAVIADRWDESRERLDRLVAASLGSSGGGLWTVHRIDRDTSGLVLFAKDAENHRSLSRAFEDRRVEKRYIAVVHGRPAWKETSCDLPLVPNGNKRGLTIIDKYQGKKSLTVFRFLGGAGNYSVLETEPRTGRTHQIRVHLAALGHPIVCDPLYGSDKPVFLSSFKPDWRGDPFEERPLLERLGLHAAEMVLPDWTGDPAPGEEGKEPAFLTLRAPLPRDMTALIKQMEKRAGEIFLPAP
ncbi:MAG: RNA pseudouridine synthase [Treponema sp.]|jgi:23S rRNA pseudouridine1911/1915/1917 synthase|nr:RNA pseudouridine synthase [Treponema sp.]